MGLMNCQTSLPLLNLTFILNGTAYFLLILNGTGYNPDPTHSNILHIILYTDMEVSFMLPQPQLNATRIYLHICNFWRLSETSDSSLKQPLPSPFV